MILLFGERAHSNHKSASSHKTNTHPVENSGILACHFDSMAQAKQELSVGQFDEYVSANKGSNYEAAVLAFASSGIAYDLSDSDSTDSGFCGVSEFFSASIGGDCGFASFGGDCGVSCSSGGYTSVA